MGKQSRRKGRDTSKKAHKERQQERRERLIEEQEQPTVDSEFDSSQREREFFKGDRVWFFDNRSDGENPDSYRGIVEKVRSDGKLDITPLALAHSGRSSWTIPIQEVFPDMLNWTLRFEVGERVVCNTDDGWVPCTVDILWPIHEDWCESEDANMPQAYMCTMTNKSASQGSPCVAAPEDLDYYIKKHPSSFRFKKGDVVTFDALKAVCVPKRYAKLSKRAWMTATINAVDITGRQDHYYVYECTVAEDKRLFTWYILEDTDEHVARKDANARERLIDAINQNCDSGHYMYLTTDMDVSILQDLILVTAIQSANYNALAWIHKELSLDLFAIRDEKGDNFLHQIAASPHAVRFIQMAGVADCTSNTSLINLHHFNDAKETFGLFEKNDQNDNWLHVLIRRDNIRALDIALSPRNGLAWLIADLSRDEDLNSLRDLAMTLKKTRMVLMIDEFLLFRQYHSHRSRLLSIVIRSEEELVQTFYGDEDKGVMWATRYYRFCQDWQDCHPRMSSNGPSDIIEKTLFDFAEAGFYRLIRLLGDVDESKLGCSWLYCLQKADAGEYCQPELFDAGKAKETTERKVNIVEAAMAGNEHTYNLPPVSSIQESAPHYMSTVFHHIDSCLEKHSWIDHIREEHERMKGKRWHSASESYWKHKIALLEDDATLDNRLKVLKYLVMEKRLFPPDPVEVIRLRQGGVLRWMESASYITLHSKAFRCLQFRKHASDLLFLNSRRIPAELSVGSFLCFAAVEFDDLQSLQWLVEEKNVSLESTVICGWNLIHASAFFGRLEIILWLQTQKAWSSLIGKVCGRKPWEKTHAVHLAVGRGHVLAADMLLSFNCPAMDANGKSPEFYASKSSYEFVRKWGEEKSKPYRLKKQIDKLLRLVSREPSQIDEAKKHIIATKCMDIDAWKDCDIRRSNYQGLVGKSYAHVVSECCKSSDFAVWLCCRLSWSTELNGELDYSFLRFWGEDPWRNEHRVRPIGLKEQVAILGSLFDGQTLTSWLAEPWARDVTVYDPSESNPLLAYLSGDGGFDEKTLRILRSELFANTVLPLLVDDGESIIRCHFKRGSDPAEIRAIKEVVFQAHKKLTESAKNLHVPVPPLTTLMPDGRINMESHLYGLEYGQNHPIRQLTTFRSCSPHELSELHRALAIEGYDTLARWCLSNAHPWDATKELEIVRIAAFLGHSRLLGLFLDHDESESFALSSSPSHRLTAAMLGGAAGGRATDIDDYLEMLRACNTPHSDNWACIRAKDPTVSSFLTIDTNFDSRDARKKLLERSLCVAAINGCLQGFTEGRSVLKTLIEKLGYQIQFILYGLMLALVNICEVSCWERFPDVFLFLREDLGLEVWHPWAREMISVINEKLISLANSGIKEQSERISRLAEEWLDTVAGLGFEVQSLGGKTLFRNEFDSVLHSAKEKQRNEWRQFDMIKEGHSLTEIEDAVNCGELHLSAKDRGGLLLTHLAAAYDRTDVLEWLVSTKNMDLSALDLQGRNVLQVAVASKASRAERWIRERRAREVISSFLDIHIRRILSVQRKNRMIRGVTRLQARHRGRFARRSFYSTILLRVEDSKRFQLIWAKVVNALSNISSDVLNWSTIREEQCDMKRAELVDLEALSEMGRKLVEASENAMNAIVDLEVPERTQDELAVPTFSCDNDDDPESVEDWAEKLLLSSRTKIHMTSDVVKWLKQSDAKYRHFFIRRMQQLAAGDRSRILAKRLKGSRLPVFETYLEQKSGHRILWTPPSTKHDELLVWFVAKHKNVSRLMQLINESESRRERQQMPVSTLPEFMNTGMQSSASPESEMRVLLDPLGNVPLKVYEVKTTELEDVAHASWMPHLHLTDEERNIVEAKGTVLVLGRSGTGKTICICNRMDLDRRRWACDPCFSQLFVARSRKLCRYVNDTIGPHDCCTFTTFRQLLHSLESLLPNLEGVKNIFPPSQLVDFARFKRDVYWAETPGDIDPLVVWTNIRTFIKGSIEAVQTKSHLLSKDEYVPETKLGKKRCRLSEEHRQIIYSVFLRYQKYVNELNLWDDCDRVVSLLQRLVEAKASQPDIYNKARKNKIYVDEIQDYTQAECLLFFYLSGPGDLFLCGDPAQSVVEGVEFRFEEIRSVGYHIAGSKRRDLIPDKPRTVNVNFRSHSGILNVAGAVLQCMFDAFPDSAKQLKKDRGLFRGPRPGLFHKVSGDRLRTLVTEKLNGAYILTHDSKVSHWKRRLAGYPLVYGIRDAKGLEFKSVILLDFFSSLPSQMQKPWRDLLLGREDADFKLKYPEVEGQLKLLYTATTRCIEQLFFAETTASKAGDAFVRWLTTTSTKHGAEEALGTRNNVDDVDAMTMTRDEWLASGMDNAESAEQEPDLTRAVSLLDKAIFCFEQAKDLAMARKARTHRSSLRLRLEMLSSHGSSTFEVETAQLVEKLLSETLLLEARELCSSLLPTLSEHSREQLESRVLNQLPRDEK